MRNAKYAIFLGILLNTLLFGTQNVSAQTARVEGIVRDSAGAVISGADVELRAGSYEARATSDAQGQFIFAPAPGMSGTVTAHAEGFSSLQQEWAADADSQVRLTLVLTPASSHEEVTVSATRTEMRLTETPGSTVMLSNTEVAATPALRVDDVLRQVPGFSLFRRSGSRVANASNQGVSLRGLGGSASSRALVLEDGLSIVDAFGGWVYWDRVPRESLQDVEVFRGGASNLYGSDTLGAESSSSSRASQKARRFTSTLRTAMKRLPTFPSGPELARESGTSLSLPKCFAPMATFSSRLGSEARSILRRTPKMRR